MKRRRRFSIAAQPVLVGGVALLVVLFGIWVSYNVTTGLPFAPRYRLSVRVPNSAQLFRGGDVTIAGRRVGQVLSIKPVIDHDGRSVAQLDLAIEKRWEPLPADTTAVVRVGGTLGSKYLALTPGTSRRTIPAGGVLPVSQARPVTVDIDQLFNLFRKPVRIGSRRNLAGFGTGLAGRGRGLNAAIGSFRPLTQDLDHVMATLAAPGTGFGDYLRALERLTAELAPVARSTAHLFVGLDATFGALARVEPDLERTITGSVPAMDTAIHTFARDRPFLRESTALFAELRPGFGALPSAASPLAGALAAGARSLPRVPGLSAQLVVATGRLAAFGERSDVQRGLGRLARAGRAFAPLTSYLAPTQTRCAYIALAFRNLDSALGEPVGASGTAARASGVVVGVSPNSERGPSDQIYSGPVAKALGPLHANPYPNTGAPGQPAECEAGNEPYVNDQPLIGTIPGRQRATTEKTSLP